jgi:hypothetical protein
VRFCAGGPWAVVSPLPAKTTSRAIGVSSRRPRDLGAQLSTSQLGQKGFGLCSLLHKIYDIFIYYLKTRLKKTSKTVKGEKKGGKKTHTFFVMSRDGLF